MDKLRAIRDSKSHEDETIHSFHQFINQMEDSHPSPGNIWYRGQTRDWPLIPSIARHMKWVTVYFLENCKDGEKPWNTCGARSVYYVNELEDSMQRERELLLRFVRESSAWLSSNRPKDYVEWYYLAQHHGVPTRLLDWTCDPLVALWFAVNGEDREDGYIYTYDVSKSRRIEDVRAGSKKDMLPELWEKSVIEAIFTGNRFPSSTDVIPISPAYYNLRQSRQASFFTLHLPYRYLMNSFWSKCAYSEEIDHTFLALQPKEKYRIQGKNKMVFRKYLARMGRHLWSIFPDMDHLATGLIREIFGSKK